MPETTPNIPSSFLNRIQLHTHFSTISSYLSAFSTFISTQFNSFLSPFTAPISNIIRIRFINYFNQTIALTIPILTNLLQLKNNSPFSTHPKTMRVSVSTTIIFYVAYTTILRFPLRRRFADMADHFLLSIGNASVASLASVLLPDSFSPFIFALFGLLSATELVYWLYQELVTEDHDYEFDVERMRVFLDNIWTVLSSFTGRPPPILPVWMNE